MDNNTRRLNNMAYISDTKLVLKQFKTKWFVRKYRRMISFNLPRVNYLLRRIGVHHKGFAYIEPPFSCDYGDNIYLGDNFYANTGFTVLDVGKVTIGDNAQIGPNVTITTAGHPVHPQARNTHYEYGIDITIGDNVWLGAGTIVLPGVHIGDNVTIGAGSVVNKDIPSNVIAAGVPCRVIREITDEDMKFYFKDREFDAEAWEVVKEGGDDWKSIIKNKK